MRIKAIAESLTKKHGTRDPFEIASCENIVVLLEPLGNIRGYYNKAFKQKMIHLNQSLDGDIKLKTCAHELGHAILHPESNTPFLRANTCFTIGKFELEAEHFGIDLIYSDEDLREYLQYSIPQIAACLQLPEMLVEYRMSVMDGQLKFLA